MSAGRWLIIVITIISILTRPIKGAGRIQKTEDEVKCKEGYSCIAAAQCKQWGDLKVKYENGDIVKDELLGLICNKKEKRVCCSTDQTEDIIQYCGEDVGSAVDLILSNSTKTVHCCHNGLLTSTTCGGDTGQCSQACGNITCVKFLPNPEEQQSCNKPDHNLHAYRTDYIEDIVLGQCNIGSIKSCACCMSRKFKKNHPNKCKCQCKCYKYTNMCTNMCLWCDKCRKWNEKCTGIICTGVRSDGCPDGTYPGWWPDLDYVNQNTTVSACAEYAYDWSYFLWTFKSGQCAVLKSDPNLGITTTGHRNTCSSCPVGGVGNSRAGSVAGKWASKILANLDDPYSYTDCSSKCNTGRYQDRCKGFNWNMKTRKCVLISDTTSGNNKIKADDYWCAAG